MVSLQPMSLNEKLSGLNGRLPSSSNWRKPLFNWLYGVVALMCLCYGPHQILSQCIDQRGVKNLLGSDIANTTRFICPKNQEFLQGHRCATDKVELIDQCPVLDDYVQRSLESLVVVEKAIALVSQFALFSNLVNHLLCGKTWILEFFAIKGHLSLSILVKGCWWIFVGILLYYKWSVFCLLWGSQEHKQVRDLTRSPQKGVGRWRKMFLVIFVSLGIVGSIWLFWHLNKHIMLMRKEMLTNMCDERARMLQDQFNVSMNHIHALAILVSTFHHSKHPSAIDQKTFGEYTKRTEFERPFTSGVAYALKVLHSNREHFEKQHGWSIKKMKYENETLIRNCISEYLDLAPIQDEYAPVIFAQETVSHIVSVDMMSWKQFRENILQARASRKGVLTSPLKLLKFNHVSFVFTSAIYDTNLPIDATLAQQIDATVGYLGASYDVLSVVDKILHQLASKQIVVVNLYDTTNASAPILMYGIDVVDTGPLHVSSLHFGDPTRKYEMHCRFKKRPPLPWTPINVSVGVIVITLLFGHIFYIALNRIAKVEDDYREMGELKARAEAADVAKSQFLATISHEIRTPMNGVLGMLQILMETELDENSMDYAQTAHRSGRDLISVIDKVLDQAKIEAGKLEHEAVTCAPRYIPNGVLSLFSGSEKKQVYRNKESNHLRNLLKHKRILVVDDNAINRKVAEVFLLKYGAKVTCVESGQAALKILKPPHSFHACFMDLRMPEMDGFEVSRQVRHLEREINENIGCGETSAEILGNVACWHMPIFAMTADATQTSNEECNKCGMDGYVSKPFEEDDLYMAVVHCFKNGS